MSKTALTSVGRTCLEKDAPKGHTCWEACLLVGVTLRRDKRALSGRVTRPIAARPVTPSDIDRSELKVKPAKTQSVQVTRESAMF